MLTDAKLKNIKGTGQPYKVADRDGLYAMVAASGGISFRYNYRVNGRQETVTLGRYGVGGMSLREAREALAEARKAVAAGVSPARTKEERIRRRKAQEPFSVWAERWLDKHRMAESTRAMRRSTYERDLKKAFGSLLLSEISDPLLTELGPLTTSICSIANVSRLCAPALRMPSMNSELLESKPRMLGWSPPGAPNASPPLKEMPGTERKASFKVAAWVSLRSSAGITVTVRGVSISGAVNLFDAEVFTCKP